MAGWRRRQRPRTRSDGGLKLDKLELGREGGQRAIQIAITAGAGWSWGRHAFSLQGLGMWARLVDAIERVVCIVGVKVGAGCDARADGPWLWTMHGGWV